MFFLSIFQILLALSFCDIKVNNWVRPYVIKVTKFLLHSDELFNVKSLFRMSRPVL